MNGRQPIRSLLALLVAGAACQSQPLPTGVPDGAVRVSFSKSGGWAHCWLDAAMQVNRCRTYNSGGERLYRFRKDADDDDVFLRYEGSGPVKQDELQIDIVHTGPDVIWLKNGVVLIPRNDFDHQKRLVDEIKHVDSRGRTE